MHNRPICYIIYCLMSILDILQFYQDVCFHISRVTYTTFLSPQIGVAVGDIEKIQRNAYLKRMALQVSIVKTQSLTMNYFMIPT